MRRRPGGLPVEGGRVKRALGGGTDGGEFPEMQTDGGSCEVPTNKQWQRRLALPCFGENVVKLERGK